MITGELRSTIDKLWLDFYSGGITNPLTVIEQISFLMFSRLLDIRESREEKKANRTGKSAELLFADNRQHLRWSQFRQKPPEEMLKIVRDEVFPHFRSVTMDGAGFSEFMKDAQLLIMKPSLLVSAVETINQLPLQNSDTKGDLYEYLLSRLTTAGIAGQFRTPRHIIQAMVEIVAPKPTDVVADPACGTAGFLVQVLQYLQRMYTSPAGIHEDEDGNKIYSGDLLEPYRKHIQTNLVHGFDFDATMLRIASMNLLSHGIDTPRIHFRDTLSNSFPEKFPRESENFFDVILANPPFKGSLDEADVHRDLTQQVKTKKTELLFIVLMLKMLKPGGRCATIVPDGVLFGSSKAHVALRQKLVDENQLEAVISLPPGVFKPYAGVSTGILVFTKGGKTKDVFYFDVQADGFSLDDKRQKIEANDLPLLIERWEKKDPKKDTDRTSKAFFVGAEEIRGKGYDLSLSRYVETVHEAEQFCPPAEILTKLRDVEHNILQELSTLEDLIK